MAEFATQDEDQFEEKSQQYTPEPEEFNDNFTFPVIAVTGSYLGQQTNLNEIKPIQITNDPNSINNNNNSNKTPQHIHTFNQYLAKKHSKLNRALTPKKLKKSTSNNDKNKLNSANIWDRQYASFCIAKNVSYSAIENYAYPMLQTQKSNDKKEDHDEKEENDIKKDENKKCDLLIKCGGCYAINSIKTSSLCDGYVFNDDNIQLFKLPSLELARSNCSSIYSDKLGVICYGGRSNKKTILNTFEVLDIENNEFEWNTNLIPPTNDMRSRHPSIGLYDDLLFVCGGRSDAALNSAECINLCPNDKSNTDLKWNRICSMNYCRSFASHILSWNRYNSLIVMGGYGSFFAEFYAEKYDLNKDKWYEFPKCNFAHKYNPCIKLTTNGNNSNELLVVICDKRTKSNLGIIEILDIRTDKWMKCKISTDQFLQLDKKQELRRLLYI